MPRSSPSTKPPDVERVTVEVVEAYRSPAEVEARPRRRGPKWWAVALALAGVGLIGLLPGGEPRPVTSDLTLPDPAVATTVPQTSRAQVAFVSDEKFATQGVSGLDGFVRYSNVVEMEGLWYLLAQKAIPGPEASLLASQDGLSWAEVETIQADQGEVLDIPRLGRFGEAIIALGTEGVRVGPDFLPDIVGDLKLWRWAGTVWVPEIVAPRLGSWSFADFNLAVSGRTLLVQASSWPVAPSVIASELDPSIVEAIEDGVLEAHPLGSDLIIGGPGSVGSAHISLGDDLGYDTTRLFRSSLFNEWLEIDVDHELGPVVPAPEGGFLVTSFGGVSYSSAFGSTWHRRPDTDGIFSADGNHVLRQDFDRALFVYGDEGVAQYQLPPDLARCPVTPGLNLVARCFHEGPRDLAFTWDGYELSLAPGFELLMRDPTSGRHRVFPLQDQLGAYSRETRELTFIDQDGVGQAFPVDVLDRFRFSTDEVSIFLSETGFEWLPSQVTFFSSEVRPIGSIDQGVLLAFPSGPEHHLTAIIGVLPK